MSDQEGKNVEQQAQEATAAVTGTADKAEKAEQAENTEKAEKEKPAPVSATPKAAPKQKSASGAVAWLALLLGLALAGGAVWSVQEIHKQAAAVDGRLAGLEESSGQDQETLDALSRRLQKQLKTGLGKVRSEMVDQAQQVAAVEVQLAEARAELSRFSATDRDSWLVAEAQYLLRLANQRLIMAGDVAAAQLLLGSADNILRELGDVGLHDVRGAVAADLAAVRAVPKVDVEGIYLRLSALIEQADKLVIFELPEKEAQPTRELEDDWQQRLQRGYEEAASKLSDYIVIRRRDVPMEALMDPQWEGLVRQNLRMLLEQAQVALLSGNQVLYRESLERSQHWVKQFFDSDEAASRAMAQEISQLQGLTVAIELPDISRSLRALDEAMEQRLQQGGGE